MTHTGPSAANRAASKMEPDDPWYRQAVVALSKHRYLKGVGTPLFIALFFPAYFYLLKEPAYLTTVMPITLLDRLIPFQPSAMPLYISLWVYVSIPPALLSTRRELNIYAAAMAATCLAGMLVFYFWPTVVPIANIDWSLYPDIDFLKRVDAAGNAFPSLHVATAVFSGVWLHRLLRGFGAPTWIVGLNVTWGFGIVYSTIATRQHVAVDALAGLALGGLAAYLALRHHARSESTAPRTI